MRISLYPRERQVRSFHHVHSSAGTAYPPPSQPGPPPAGRQLLLLLSQVVKEYSHNLTTVTSTLQHHINITTSHQHYNITGKCYDHQVKTKGVRHSQKISTEIPERCSFYFHYTFVSALKHRPRLCSTLASAAKGWHIIIKIRIRIKIIVIMII